ncbi:MAG: hypothetical protein AB1578_19735 [Thermodesulfobacteriota bacterium]
MGTTTGWRVAVGLAVGLALEAAWILPCRPAAAQEAPPGASVAQTVGPDLAAAYGVDPREAGLSGEAREEFERRRFEVQSRVVRLVADLDVLRRELARLLDDRRFDLTAAQKKVGEISVAESSLRSAHVELAHALAGALTDEQWRLFRRLAEGDEPPPGPAAPSPHRGTPER